MRVARYSGAANSLFRSLGSIHRSDKGGGVFGFASEMRTASSTMRYDAALIA
jgi:hypothetical protein